MSNARTIKAKPVIYRSQLEHEWAMHFAMRGVKFIYEPRYYRDWLPDFELIDLRLLIEIKPTADIWREECGKALQGLEMAEGDGFLGLIVIGSPNNCEARIYLGQHGYGGCIIWTPELRTFGNLVNGAIELLEPKNKLYKDIW